MRVPYSSGVKYKDAFIKQKGASHVRIMPNSLNVTDLWKAKKKRPKKVLYSTTWIIRSRAEILGENVVENRAARLIREKKKEIEFIKLKRLLVNKTEALMVFYQKKNLMV